ncbi:carboxylic ester hydrolase LipN-like [Gigantopelta aegis]|uniref:carboxylic ester hydrolase LipN-like n=1 Tax=Gigantopelta aegis TaxID=1735272 RepID=UPI001B888DEA|nr:carboxylic ester hydrolase LipN-like [Gigantopelta aegis]
MPEGYEELRKKYKLHEETESFFQICLESVGWNNPTCDTTVIDSRRIFDEKTEKFAGDVTFEGTVKEYIVPSAACEGGIPVDVLIPKNCGARPSILVHFHGGGYVMGSRMTDSSFCKLLASEALCVVVNVEYRLAPEHKFPAAVDDARCVLRWVLMNKPLVGGMNESKVGVCGSSSGGGLAAVVSSEIPGISYQILINPWLDITNGQPTCYEFETAPYCCKRSLDWLSEEYIRDPSDKENPRASPLLRKNIGSQPPTLFLIAELDPLRDQAYEYKKKLKEAGGVAESMLAKGAVHAYMTYPGHFKELGIRGRDRIMTFIKKRGTV